MNTYDFAVIGGGIVGISTALSLQKKYAGSRIILIEKEKKMAAHQTGHNSGVVHAGVYYEPGSLKAEFCRKGSDAIKKYCEKYRLPYKQIGKLLVATDDTEFERMKALKIRCRKNNLCVDEINAAELRRLEPNISGLGALFVHDTAITDFPLITRFMSNQFREKGGTIQTGAQVSNLAETSDEVVISVADHKIKTQFLVACAGLQADRLAKMMGIRVDFEIIPFRGEYYRLARHHHQIVKRLIYPIPDPGLPFLGVHLTPMISGEITVGPNAVLGFKREGYNRFNFSIKDTSDMLLSQGFWRVVSANMQSGISEFFDSNYKPGYLKRIRKYCPRLELSDLKPYPAGIRAQAVKKDGTMVHDFLFAQTKRSLHVCNAPSPAATSAIPISEYICDKVAQIKR